MDILSLRSVQETRNELLNKMEAIATVAKGEDRDMTTDEQTAFDGLLAKHKDLEAAELRAEKYEAALKHSAKPRPDAPQLRLTDDPPQQRIPAIAAGPPPRNFTGPNARKDAHDAGMWARAVLLRDPSAAEYCAANGLDVRMDAQTVDDTARGGALVPTPLAAAIIAVRDSVGVAGRICRPWPMVGETDSVPKRISGLTVYAKGEEEAATSSEAQWGNVPLSVTDKYTLTKISRKLMRASVIALADYLVDEVGFAFSQQRDREVVNGDSNAGAPYWGETGLQVALGAAGKQPASGTGWGGIVAGDFASLVGILPEKYHLRASWLMSRSFWATVLEPIIEAAGGNSKREVEDATRPFYKGYPVNLTDEMPKTSGNAQVPVLFGSFFDAVLLGEREGIEIATSDQAFWTEDQIGIRGHEAYDIAVHDAGNGSVAGAYVGLLTGGS
ncbi:MAG: phage major capsid protein [Planctomycetota bacterium]